MHGIAERSTHHVDDHSAKGLPLFLRQVLEDVAVFPLEQLKPYGQVMVLENGFVVVHERQFRVCKARGVKFIYKAHQSSVQYANNKE